MAEQNNQILLETKDLQKHFPIKDFFGRKKQAVKAVDGITFQIRKGETFGLVGESGCGKSTLGRTLIRMYEPTGGQIIFDGEDITKLEGAKLQPYHKRMQIIFQDPYSALDVSIQAQVVNMLEDLQEELGLTYLFVAHDLSMVRHISTRIGVMYLGKIVEIAESDELYDRPFHPYTEALLSAIPVADPKFARSSKRKIIKGDLPSPMDVPGGCRFHTRCPYAKPECGQMEPPLVERTPGHFVACHIR